MSEENKAPVQEQKPAPKKSTPKAVKLADGAKIVTAAGGFKFKVRS